MKCLPKVIFTSLFIFCGWFTVLAQVHDVKWRDIINKEEGAWYASSEAKEMAENVLLFQRNIGGWGKNIQMHQPLSKDEKLHLIALKDNLEGITIDNGATTQEMLFLSKMYRQVPDERYRKAFLLGLEYLLNAQYDNGGFPQYYPSPKGYGKHITFNDNAMVNALKVLKNCIDEGNFYSIRPPDATIERARKAFDKGIECILKTQYKQNAILTSWCAQHDKITLEPAKARSYELPSLSGSESAQIVLLLMSIENPSKDVITAVDSVVEWFKKVKITGLREIRTYNEEGKLMEKKMIPDANASFLWARFMELDSNIPFFCDRDGIKKYAITEIKKERRNGYRWYTNAPQKVLEKYKEWKRKYRN
ncbi:MAG: pectate lyase [Saprospiraceae bacterium]